MKTQTFLMQNQSLQSIPKLHINYPKTIVKIEKVGSSSSLHSDPKKVKLIRTKKKPIKNKTKQQHAFKVMIHIKN